MPIPTPLISKALTRAREDWLDGDPSAWSRYTNCVAQLEDHVRRVENISKKALDRPPMPGWNPLSSPYPQA